MKKIIYFLLIALFCGAFVSCSKDGDGDNGGNGSSYEELIVGEWTLVKEYYDGEYDYYDEGEYGMIFKKNGTGYGIEDGYRDEEFEWEINGSSLYVTDGYYETTAKIKKLSKKELVVDVYDEYDDEEWTSYYERVE